MSRCPSLLARRFRPRLDWLEGRDAPAVFTVTSATDDPLDVNTLRAAITQANRLPGADEIRFSLPAGSTITVNPTAGGGNGVVQGALPTITDELTVSGPGVDALTVSGGKQARVFAVAPSARAVSFAGLTIADGKLTASLENSDPLQASGAGIFNQGAALTLSGVRLRGHSTAGVVGGQPAFIVSANGVAVFSSGPLTVTGSAFEGNSGSISDGGGILALGPAAVTSVTGSTFTDNAVSLGSGGGIFAEDAPLTVAGSTFTNNSAGFDGGAISSGLLTAPRAFSLADLTFTGNSAAARGGALDPAALVNLTGSRLTFVGNTAQGAGGGLYLEEGGAVALTDVSFTGNKSVTAGGGGLHAHGNLTVSGGLFQGNTAGTAGGGVFFEDATPTQGLTNVTLTGNTAKGQGGGVYADDGTGLARLVQVTATGNAADTGGGLASEDGDLVVFNSVVAGNTALTGPADLAAVASAGGNVFGAADAASATLFQPSDIAGVTDPGLTALGSFGGFSQSVAPRLTSPAIGRGLAAGTLSAGGVSVTLTAPATDQRGLARPSDGAFDSGAVQPQRPTAATDTVGVSPGSPTTIPAATLLGNDTVVDTGLGGTLTATLASGPLAGTGTLVQNADGSLTYTPDAGFSGSDATFSYRVSDGFSTSRPVTATVRVLAAAGLTAPDRPDYVLDLGTDDTLVVDAVEGLLAGVISPNGGTVRVAAVTPGFGLPAVTFAPGEGDFVVDQADGSFTLTLPVETPDGVYTFTYTVTDGLTTSGPATATVTVSGGLVSTVGQNFTAYGSGAGTSAVVRVLRPLRSELVLRPFEASFQGGVRVALADLTGDGVDDVVVGAGPGGGPRVMVFDGASSTTAAPVTLADFFAFNADFRGGAHVAAAATTSDGIPTSLLVVGAGSFADQPGSPRVVAFRGLTNVPRDGSVAASPALSFNAYDPSFQGGVRVAVGDLKGTGTLQIVTVPGPSGGPNVKVWDTATASAGTPAMAQSFLGLSSGDYRGGAFVAVSDGVIVVTPDSLASFPGTVLAANSGQLPDTAGATPGAASAANTSSPPAVRVFLSPLLLGRPSATSFVDESLVAAPPLGDETFAGGIRPAIGRPAGSNERVVLFGFGPGRGGQVRQVRFTPEAVRAAGATNVNAVLDTGNELGTSRPLADLVSDTEASVYVALAPAPLALPRR